jgi:hypothetical protein
MYVSRPHDLQCQQGSNNERGKAAPVTAARSAAAWALGDEVRMNAKSRYRSVPLHRRWVNDIIHFGKKSHVIGCNWRINLAPAVAARATRQPIIGWTAMWVKALALASQRYPELRTAYLPFPWARLYVHADCVCTVAIERTWQGASAVFFDQIRQADATSLTDLDHWLRRLKQEPVESFSGFRRIIRFARPPVLVRRLIWSLLLYWSGPLRAQYIGTCALDPFPTGGSVTQSATPISFLLYYGLVAPNGDTQVQVLFDHRVMDGIDAYRIVRSIETTLNREIAAELKQGIEAPERITIQPEQNGA